MTLGTIVLCYLFMGVNCSGNDLTAWPFLYFYVYLVCLLFTSYATGVIAFSRKKVGNIQDLATMANEGPLQSARNLVEQILTSAKSGDPEALGWVIVVVLTVVLGIVAFKQVFISDSVSPGKAPLPPSYNVGLPIIGNLLSFASNPLDLVWDAYATKGEVFTVRLLHKRLTFVIGPAACESFFKASDVELDQNEPYRFSTPVFGKDVVYDAKLENRLQHFRILSMTLRVNMLEAYVPLMIKEANDFFRKWGNSGEVDLFDELGRLIILTGSRCIMGREVRESLFGEISHLIHDLDQGMQPISVLANWLPIKAHRVRDRARKQMDKLFEPIIKARRESGIKEEDMLQWLVEARYRDGRPFADHEIVGNLVAGVS